MKPEYDKIVTKACTDLSRLLTEEGASRSQEEYAYYRLFCAIKDVLDDELAPLEARKNREQVFRQSGEAAIENKVDDARDRMWYKRLMESSKDGKDE